MKLRVLTYSFTDVAVSSQTAITSNSFNYFKKRKTSRSHVYRQHLG